MSEPLLDIVMLVSKQGTWSDLAIRAVEHHTKNSYRLIIVDQAVTDLGIKLVIREAQQRGHTVVHMAENRSFSNGNNAGIRIGSSKYVVVLNDDAIVSENWDTHFIQDLSDKSIGLVGARTNYAAGPTADPSWIGEPPFMAFVCVGFRREVWEQVGPLDEERFDGFAAEDLDYCFRVKQAGYKLKVSNAYVLHAGSRSIPTHAANGSTDPATLAAAYNAHNEKYNRVLVEKWGKDFVEQNTKLRQKVLVVSYHAEEWTRVRFAGSLLQLKAGAASGASGGIGPDGGNFGFTYYQHTRTPIHLARQLVSDYATNNGFDILIQMDDDAADFPADLIRRFLIHGKDVVTALAYQRKPPYLPCVYERVSEDAVNGNPMEGIEHTGLRKVDVSGFHCSMIRTSVFKKLREAGITDYWGGFDLKCGEDFALAFRLRKIGIPIYCDTDLIVGHIATGPVIDENYKRLYREGKAQ